MALYSAPGVYMDVTTRAPVPALETGVPAFVGFSVGALGEAGAATYDRLSHETGSSIIAVDGPRWSMLQKAGFGASVQASYVGLAVRGFFENGGRRCYLAPNGNGLQPLQAGLTELEAITDFDLLCAPDLVRLGHADLVAQEQQHLLRFAARQRCFAILDSLACPGVAPSAELAAVNAHRDNLTGPDAAYGALYVPWIKVVAERNELIQVVGRSASNAVPGQTIFIPPCGHVAGVYARTDQRVGVHKAPANEVVQGISDVQTRFTENDQQGQTGLNAKGINAIRAFPGRGIRIWGARTLGQNQALAYVNVQRLVLTVGRWLEQMMQAAVFEPNDAQLWTRIRRDVDAYLGRLFEKGAFAGNSRNEAYFVKCDAETNPPAVREAGQVVTEVGIAPRVPSELVHLRVTLGREGVAVTNF